MITTASGDPPPSDEVEGVVDAVPVGASPPQRQTDEREQCEADGDPEPGLPDEHPHGRHAVTATERCALALDEPLVDREQPPRDVGPGVALLRERARRRRHRDAAGLVGEQRDDGLGERARDPRAAPRRRSPGVITSR